MIWLSKKFAYQEIYDYFLSKNCILLEDKYKDAKTKMKYQCECGNISYISLNNFKTGRRCAECKKRKLNNIKKERIWISKFMELGKGQWGDNPEDLKGLRRNFIEHLKKYDRIFTLRALSREPNWYYELVEIPKQLMELAETGTLKMMTESKQYPKPGYCYVKSDTGQAIYELYFDAGSERKLQVKNLPKSRCTVHATWEFTIPSK